MAPKPIELKDVTFSYPGAERPAVDRASAVLHRGQFQILIGPNGSGKSTLGKLLAGLIEPDSGTIQGRRESPGQWNGVGIVMQDAASQLVSASVEEELAWGLENLDVPRDQIELKVEAALLNFGLSHLRRHAPEHLSDGERQLVAVASVMIMDPDLLILDEATAYLDPHWRLKVRETAMSASLTCAVLWLTSRKRDAEGVHPIWRMTEGRLEC